MKRKEEILQKAVEEFITAFRQAMENNYVYNIVFY
jgi:hypothetical protein